MVYFSTERIQDNEKKMIKEIVLVIVLMATLQSSFGYKLELDDLEECSCPRILMPVCDDQGRSYGNICAFECAQEQMKLKGVHIQISECKSDNQLDEQW